MQPTIGDAYCWTSFSIYYRKLEPSGWSRLRRWRCIGRMAIPFWWWSLTVVYLSNALTLICEAIRYRLVEVRHNPRKKSQLCAGGPPLQNEVCANSPAKNWSGWHKLTRLMVCLLRHEVKTQLLWSARPERHGMKSCSHKIVRCPLHSRPFA